jgi:lipid-A-disaccharide synthase
MARRVLFVAGEASGDLHGAGVVRALRELAPDVVTAGVGGDRMAREGMHLVHHCRDLSFMGFIEVVKHLGTIRKLERELDSEMDARRPDVVVLIDYPGFNLRFARRVKRRGIPILYYISPQVWAWNRGRVKTMARLIDRMKVVFPFEVELYRSQGMNVEFVGHPLAEHLSAGESRVEFLAAHGLDPGKKLLALFPGSRPLEIERILPVMAEAARSLVRTHGVQAALGVAPNLGADALRRFLPADAPVALLEHATHGLMAHADVALVASGTATLETGWFGTPMIVVYRTSPVSYAIGRTLVHLPYIGLVNIIAGKKVVPEFVQGEMTAGRLASEAGALLDDESRAARMREELSVIRERLGGPGASLRVARGILELAEHS